MPPARRFFAVGLWLAVTAAATAIVWAGTSTVAADLTDRPAPLVAHHDVVSALESGTTGAETAPGISTPEANRPAPTVPPDAAGAATGAPAAAVPQSPAAASSPDAPAVPGPVAPPATGPTSPPTTQAPPRSTATYSTAGGVVTVACKNSFFIELVSATPTNGYTAKVVNGGPFYVEVHFVRVGRDEPVWAFCAGGVPVQAYGGTQIPRPVS